MKATDWDWYYALWKRVVKLNGLDYRVAVRMAEENTGSPAKRAGEIRKRARLAEKLRGEN